MVIRRAPLMPRGWPSATAPPFTLTLSGSRPSSRMTTIDWLANASLSSIRSMSSTSRSALRTAILVGGVRPEANTPGATPAEGGTQASQGFHACVGPRVLVAFDGDGLALGLGHHDRHDLVHEAAFLDRLDRALVAAQGERVLLPAAHARALGDVLAGF